MTDERRRCPRQRVSLQVDVRFLAEEETFTPFQFGGCVADMSVSGAMVTIPDIGAEQYDVLFRRPRFMRITCQFPFSDRPTLLFGRVVWHELCETKDLTFCRSAVAFEPLNEKDIGDVERFLQEHADSTEEVAL